jgi:cytochrome c-type biogenesis protein CcmH
MISPAATFAFQKAADINPEHPGPPFFFGQALAQSGRLPEARQVWSELLARTPAESPLHDELQSRVSRIDAMLGVASGQGETGAVPPVAAPKADAPAADASATP